MFRVAKSKSKGISQKFTMKIISLEVLTEKEKFKYQNVLNKYSLLCCVKNSGCYLRKL